MGREDTGIEIDFVDDDPNIAFDANQTIDLYVYKLSKLNKTTPLFEKDSHSIFTCSTDVSSDFNSYIIKTILTTEDGELISSSTSSSSLAKILKRNKRLSAYTNDFKGKIEDESVYAVVIGEQLDVIKADLKEQNVFYISTISPISEMPDDISGILDPKSIATLEMENFQSLEDEFLNARAYYTLDETWNTHKSEKIIIEIQKQALINSMKIEGIQENGLKDELPIEIDKKLVPIMFNPIEFQDELHIYSPWLDYDFAFTFSNAKKFTTAQPISAMLTEERQQNLLLDLLLTSYAYATDFNFVDYVIEGSDAGKIKGNQYIGYSARQASSLTSKTPLNIMDSIFEKYIRDNPQDEDSDELRFIQQAIAALSRWIQSSRAVGKGNNSFNKIYLPFTLKLFGGLDPIKIDVDSPIPQVATKVKSWVLKNNNTKFILNSLYFGFSKDKIENTKLPFLNELRVVQLDRKTTIPFLDDTVSITNKTPLPGDINTQSAKDLKYLFYTNIAEDKLQKFFATEPTLDALIPKGTKIQDQTSQFAPYGKVFNSAKELFDKLGYTQNFISGNIETVATSEKDIVFTYDYVKQAQTKYVSGDQSAYDAFKDSKITKEQFAAYLKVNPTTIVDFKYTPSVSLPNSISRISYKLTHSRLTQLSYEVTANSGLKQSALKRKAIFDKYSWKEEIDLYSDNPTNKDQKYSLEIKTKSSIIELSRMILRQIFGEEVILHINGLTKTLFLHNKDDQEIGVERILFR